MYWVLKFDQVKFEEIRSKSRPKVHWSSGLSSSLNNDRPSGWIKADFGSRSDVLGVNLAQVLSQTEDKSHVLENKCNMSLSRP